MSTPREKLFVIIGAVIAVVFQLILAPNIAVGNASPNFLLEFTLVIAVSRGGRPATVLAFILGLIFGLLSSNPVGAMAFALVAAGAVASFVVRFLDNDTFFMPAVILMAAVLLTQLIYGILLCSFVPEIGIVDALVYRALPCALYDAVLSVIILLIARKFMSPKKSDGPMNIPTFL